MTAREAESRLLSRCTQVARAQAFDAQDGREANVFRLASMLLRFDFPDESTRLMQASEAYFAHHPEQQLPAQEVLQKGWVIGLPRMRDMLSRQLALSP